MMKDALAAEIALVLDELGVELIRTQHMQDVLYFETDALKRVLHGVSFIHHFNATCLLVPPKDDAFCRA